MSLIDKDISAVSSNKNPTRPTIYLLDICKISHIKDVNSGKDKARDKAMPLIQDLREIDTSENKISIFLALQEKISDVNTKHTKETLIEETLRDIEELKVFFKNADIVENHEWVKAFITECFGSSIEEDSPKYRNLLDFANNHLCLYNSPKNQNRLKLVKTVCEKADELNMARNHTVCLAIVGSIYGCNCAKSVIGFSEKDFKSSNALGDIMAVQRTGKILYELLGKYKVSFKTDDNALEEFADIFAVNDVETQKNFEGSISRYDITTKANKLFPDFFDENGMAKDELSAEYEKLGELLQINLFEWKARNIMK